MQSFSYVISDELGLHARPAGLLAKQVQKFRCRVSLSVGDMTVDANRVLGLMKMGIKCGQKVLFVLEGEDEETAAAELEAFCRANI